ncbi:hypothetical protein Esti_005046 [Eimeria stiedai]
MHHSASKDERKPPSGSRVTAVKTSDAIVKGDNKRSADQLKLKKKKPKVVYCVALTKYRVVKKVCASFPGWTACDNEDDDWDLLWTDASISVERLLKMKPYQKINHLVGTHAITSRKNYLGRNLQRMKAYYPKEYKYFPSTWILPTDAASLRAECADKKKKTFIVKPDCGSQGRGIFLTQNINDIDFDEHLVAQRYIHKPFLIDGLKFDLRLYLLITGCNPLRLFLHKDGLVRFATNKYEPPNPRNCGDLRMHLTNYAINRSSTKFQNSTDPQDALDGHKRSLYHVMERLRQEGKDVDAVANKINDMLVRTIIAIQPSLAHIYSSCQAADPTNSMCFEIFGVDVMLDSKLEPWLLEVNHSPSFATDSPLDNQVKFAVIKDTLRLVGILKKNRKRYMTCQKNAVERNIGALRTPSAKRNRMQERDQEKAEFAQQRTEWEDKHLGGFKRIYPTSDGDAKYNHLFEAANEIWGNTTGITRTRPLLEKLQQIRRAASDQTSNPPLQASSKQTHASPRSLTQNSSGSVKIKSGAIPRQCTKATECSTSHETDPQMQMTVTLSKEEHRKNNTRPAKCRSSSDYSRIVPRGGYACLYGRRHVMKPSQKQQPLPRYLNPESSLAESSDLLDKHRLPGPLQLSCKTDVSASQASTEAPSEAREAAGHVSADACTSSVARSDESIQWPLLLSASSSGLISVPSTQPTHMHSLQEKKRQKTREQQILPTNRLRSSHGNGGFPRSKSITTEKPPLRLPQIELSLMAPSMSGSSNPPKPFVQKQQRRLPDESTTRRQESILKFIAKEEGAALSMEKLRSKVLEFKLPAKTQICRSWRIFQ